MKYNLAYVYDALMETFQGKRFAGSSGNEFRAEVYELAVAISEFKFMMCFIISRFNVLFEVTFTKKMLLNRNYVGFERNYNITTGSSRSFDKFIVQT